MQGKIIWYHPELRVALIERASGFTVGTVEEGEVAMGDVLRGNMRTEGLTRLELVGAGRDIMFTVEAEALTEDQASELLGFVRD